MTAISREDVARERNVLRGLATHYAGYAAQWPDDRYWSGCCDAADAAADMLDRLLGEDTSGEATS